MIFKFKRKLAKRLWKEVFYFYLWLDDWLKRNPEHKPVSTIYEDRNSRELDADIDRTER